MTKILHRQPRSPLPVAVAGDGPYLIDRNGKRYLDASGGAAVSCLGHSYRPVIEAIKAQLDQLPYAHTGFFTNEPAETLAEHLIARAPKRLERVYFVSGGSEATETAMKLARQYFYERGELQRRHFIARRQSYHGNTIGALSLGGNPGRREIYEPILQQTTHISPCYAYRGRGAEETEEAYGQRVADELESALQTLGPETVIAFCAETVVGATLGAVPAVPGYFRRVREICDRYGVLLILDEVMCGMGRTGTLYACEQDGVEPDILTCAKGLGAGYQPIGACLLSGEIHETIVKGSGFFQHGFTYIGHAAAAAGALEVQRSIEREGLLSKVRDRGAELRASLDARLGEHPHVGDIRGRGLFLGIELVSDRDTKEPFDSALRLHAQVKRAAMDRGLMCYPNGGTADGLRGDHVLIAPPYIIDGSQIDEIAETLHGAIDAALDKIG